MIELGREAVTLSAFHWMEGMALAGGGCCVGSIPTTIADGKPHHILSTGRRLFVGAEVEDPVLDVQHPGSKGCLLQLVRDGLGCQELVVAYDADDGPGMAWRLVWPDGHSRELQNFNSSTEEGVLVSALRAASEASG